MTLSFCLQNANAKCKYIKTRLIKIGKKSTKLRGHKIYERFIAFIFA